MKWNKVTDKLPELLEEGSGRLVIIYQPLTADDMIEVTQNNEELFDEYSITCAVYFDGEFTMPDPNGGWARFNVTHWMYLPESPKD